MNLQEYFEQTYLKQVDWSLVKPGDPTDICYAKAEEFLMRCLLEHHELPIQGSSECSFTIGDLAKQLPEDKVAAIWEEVLQKFPPVA